MPLLAVGGDCDLRKLLAGVFRKTHRLDFAASPTAALRHLAEKRYGAVLVIGPLPDGGEWELMDAISRLGENPPIVLLTTHSDPSAEQKALRKGAVAVVLLPFDVRELRRVVQAHELQP